MLRSPYRGSPDISDMSYTSEMSPDEDLPRALAANQYDTFDHSIGLLDPEIAQDRQHMLGIADRLRSVG